MKIYLILLFTALSILPSANAQEVSNPLDCGESSFFYLSDWPTEVCVAAKTLESARRQISRSLITAIYDAYNVDCIATDCPSIPDHYGAHCFRQLPQPLPQPTVSISGDSLIFCFTFASTFFEMACGSCRYRKRYPIDPWLKLAPQEALAFQEEWMSLSPNPAQDQVELRYGLSQTSNVNWQISHMNGQVVLQSANQEAQARGNYRQQVDIQNLAPGLYLLVVYTQNGHLGVQKLLVQR